MGPQPAHPREVVLELGELDLELALRGVRVGGEDVQDHRGAVHDRGVERLLEVALLARRELVVGDDDVRVGRLDRALQFLDLAAAHVGVRVRRRAVLHRRADDVDPGGAQQLAQLGEIVALGKGGDEERPLFRALA